MTFSQVISPFHSLSVWKYNYVEDAYSSLCFAAVCSVRCISREAEETRSLCLYLSVRVPWVAVCLPLRLSWIRRQVTLQAGDHHLITQKEVRISASVFHCWFFLGFILQTMLDVFIYFCKHFYDDDDDIYCYAVVAAWADVRRPLKNVQKHAYEKDLHQCWGCYELDFLNGDTASWKTWIKSVLSSKMFPVNRLFFRARSWIVLHSL